MTEQFEIVALTDVDVAYVQPTPKEGEVMVRKSITAYKRLDTGEVQEGLFELATLAAPARGQLFRISLPSDAMVRVHVAKGEQGKLWMTELPAPAKDEDLLKLLEQQVAEKTFTDDTFGVFSYDRETCVYQCDIDWRDKKKITLEIENIEADKPRAVARTLQAEAEKWELAARAQIKAIQPAASRMSLRSLSVDEDGAFTFWFAGKAGIACAAGSLDEGVTDATVI